MPVFRLLPTAGECCYHSGRLLSSIVTLTGSFNAGICACLMALWMISFMWLWRWGVWGALAARHCQSGQPACRRSFSTYIIIIIIIVIDHPRSGVVYYFGSVCLFACPSVCLSVCMYVCMSDNNSITFESLDIGSSYLHILCISREYGSDSYMKVIGSRSRSQEQKRSKILIPANFARQ